MTDDSLENTPFIDIDEEDLEPTDRQAYFEKEEKYPLIRTNYKNKLTPERFDAIIQYVGQSCHPKHAAMAAGVSPNTMETWLRVGEANPNSIYGIFYQSMMSALGQAIAMNTALIQAAAVDDWKAADRLNSILDPNLLGKNKQCIEISGPDGLPIAVKQDETNTLIITNDELAKMLACEEQCEAINALPSEDEIRKHQQLEEDIKNQAVEFDPSLGLGEPPSEDENDSSEDSEEY